MKTSIKTAIATVLITALGVSGVAVSGLANSFSNRGNSHVAQANDNDKQENEELASEKAKNEQQEAAQLQSLAKIIPQQAQQVAEASVGDKASSVELEDEDSSLVYEVAIGQKEVVIDAENGRVLYTESEN